MYVHNHAIRTSVLTLVITSVVLWLTPAMVFAAGVEGTIGSMLYSAVVSGTGILLTFATFIFEAALSHFVWGFGEYYSQYFGFAIETVWAVVRDLMNFMFIFGLIYIGFRFILNADDQKAKNNLVMLIMAALLVNFSLFFAKAVIDISHLAAKELQAPIETISCRNNPEACDKDISIGNAMLNSLQLSSVLSDRTKPGDGNLGFMMALTVTTGALILVAAFTIGSLGILLLTRFVILTFLLIFSPIMFIGWVFPGLSGWSKKWMDTFLRQAFLAPALILCLYISLSMVVLVGNINGVNNQDLLAPLNEAKGSSGANSEPIELEDAVKNAIPFFVLGIGFFMGSLVAAKQIGAVGAGGIIKVGQNIGGRARRMAQRGAGGATFGVAARAGRITAGSAGGAIKDNEGLQRAARSGGLKGFAARRALSAADTAHNASFDARQLGGIGKDLGIGTGKKGGRAQRQKDINEKEQRLAKLASEGSDTQVYKDEGIEHIHEKVANLEKERNEKLAKLNSTKDKAQRSGLVNNIKQIEGDLQMITSAPKEAPTNFNGTDTEWQQKRQEYLKYNQTKKDMKKTLQNQYAASLTERGKDLPKKVGVKLAYNIAIRSEKENMSAANTISKEVNKGDNDKLIDAIEKINKKDE